MISIISGEAKKNVRRAGEYIFMEFLDLLSNVKKINRKFQKLRGIWPPLNSLMSII